MGNKATIGGKIVLEGEGEYRKALKNITASQKELRSEMELSQSTFRDSRNSVEALEEMFSEYEGVLVFVSHDEAFIRACATQILEVKNGKILPYPGTPDAYFAQNFW